MHSKGSRIAAAVVAVAAVVVLFFAFKGGDDEAEVTTSVATTTSAPESDEPRGKKPDEPRGEKPDEPAIPTITIKDGQPKGGVLDLSVNKGDEVAFVVDSDTADEIHVHGYDVSAEVEAGGTAKIDFTADIDGIFEVELENTAVPIAELTVNP